MNPLTIVIPTYERPEYLAECLQTVEAQTRRDFDLVVLDNASTCDYRPVLDRFAHLSIEYLRNETNIGSGPNQAKARAICARSEYGMVFHDDDLMHPRLIEWELGLMESHPDAAWVASECSQFLDGSAPPFELWQSVTGKAQFYFDQASLVRQLLNDSTLHFGSAVYRSRAMDAFVPRLQSIEKFHIVGDRPYMLEVARSGSMGLIAEPLVLYRLHGAQDTHDPNFSEDQAISLMHYYRDFLPEVLDPQDERVFMRHSTNYLLHVHSFTRSENHDSFWRSVARERAEGLFRWRSIDGQGAAAIAGMMGVGSAFEALRAALRAAKRAVRTRS